MFVKKTGFPGPGKRNTHLMAKIGIALSGGGIKGLCHAGALKALEESGIRPDILSGVSAGAIVGSLYADGYSPDEIADFFQDVTFRQMTRLGMHGGVFDISEFERFLGRKLRARTFADLRTPLRVVATDLDHGRSVTFGEGELLPCVIASCSVPVLFMPRQIDGVNYVDGGVLKNFPATTLRPLCDTLIGINASPMVAEDYKLGLVSVALRSYHFMMKANILHDKEVCETCSWSRWTWATTTPSTWARGARYSRWDTPPPRRCSLPPS